MYLSTVILISIGLNGVITASKMANNTDKKNFFLYGAAYRNTLRSRATSKKLFLGSDKMK